jgi:hypothetical protein
MSFLGNPFSLGKNKIEFDFKTETETDFSLRFVIHEKDVPAGILKKMLWLSEKTTKARYGKDIVGKTLNDLPVGVTVVPSRYNQLMRTFLTDRVKDVCKQVEADGKVVVVRYEVSKGFFNKEHGEWTFTVDFTGQYAFKE